MDKPRILFVSYHFSPSSEIGAKRPTETARYLSSHGYQVTVLRGLRAQDAGNDPFAADWPNARFLTVSIPTKFLSGLLMKVRSRLSAAPQNSDSDVQNDEASNSSNNIRQSGLLHWGEKQYIAWESLFMGDKWWALRCVLRLITHILVKRNKFDLVITSGPPTAVYLVAWIASRFSSAPYCMDMRDPWNFPGEGLRTATSSGHWTAKVESYWGRKIIGNAHLLTVAAPGIGRIIEARYGGREEPPIVILNGYDGDPACDGGSPVGTLRLLYAGTLYPARNPLPLFAAIEELVTRPEVERSKVKLLMVGDCSVWNGIALDQWVKDKNLGDVIEFLPQVSREKLVTLTSNSNLLVNFSEGQVDQIPGKSFEYIAANRELLIFAETESDTAKLHAQHKVGIIVQSHRPTDILDQLAAQYRRSVVEMIPYSRDINITKKYDRQTQLRAFEALIAGAI